MPSTKPEVHNVGLSQRRRKMPTTGALPLPPLNPAGGLSSSIPQILAPFSKFLSTSLLEIHLFWGQKVKSLRHEAQKNSEAWDFALL